MPDGKIPLVYILSNGRSGSTLLDLLLGSAPGAWTVGEAQLLPWELKEPQAPCGCGQPISECGFWSDVIPELRDAEIEYPINLFRERRGSGQVLRWRLVVDLLRGKVARSRQQAVEQYGRANAVLFRAVREAARERGDREVRWLIDASKDPYRLLWLTESGLFDLRVIHLTKSAPAFVYSTVRPELPRGIRKTVRMAGRWVIENGLMIQMCRAAFGVNETRHLRYEDLAGRPDDVRDVLGNWLGLDFPNWEGHTFRAYDNHAIAGNKMRWEDTEVRLDSRWKRNMPFLHKNISRIFGAPLSGSLGY